MNKRYSVLIIPVDAQGRSVLVTDRNHPSPAPKIPGGKEEPEDVKSPEDSARRELLEETGLHLIRAEYLFRKVHYNHIQHVLGGYVDQIPPEPWSAEEERMLVQPVPAVSLPGISSLLSSHQKIAREEKVQKWLKQFI